MAEYIVSEPFTVEVTETKYALDFAMDRYVLTKVCEYGERLNLERVIRCRDCKHSYYDGTVCHPPILNGGYDGNPYLDITPDGFCAWGERKVVE